MLKVFKYLSPLTIYIAAYTSFTNTGWLTWLPMLYAWVLVPATELLLQPNPANLDAAEEEMARKNRWYDYMLYIIVPFQYAALFIFLSSLETATLHWWEIAGRVASMGLLCGTFGINVAHELGHRIQPFEQWLAKSLLATSLYMHFFIEHNKGHHKNVATPEDPSSARLNEPVYSFYFRTIFYSYLSAWKIAANDCRKKGESPFSFSNEMVQVHLIQLALLFVIFAIFGGTILIYFVCSALLGIALLETVNYIEHYGLVRKQMPAGQYERAMPWHSWNSNHPIGRIMLFELSRHSDHHYLASRKYQILKHHDHAPQLPTGYPGSMLLSLVPPLWFKIMNRRISEIKKQADNNVLPE